jgi:hypothetical protein
MKLKIEQRGAQMREFTDKAACQAERWRQYEQRIGQLDPEKLEDNLLVALDVLEADLASRGINVDEARGPYLAAGFSSDPEEKFDLLFSVNMHTLYRFALAALRGHGREAALFVLKLGPFAAAVLLKSRHPEVVTDALSSMTGYSYSKTSVQLAGRLRDALAACSSNPHKALLEQLGPAVFNAWDLVRHNPDRAKEAPAQPRKNKRPPKLARLVAAAVRDLARDVEPRSRRRKRVDVKAAEQVQVFEQVMFRSEVRSDLKTYMRQGRVTRREQFAFVSHHLEGLTEAAIAERLNVSVGCVSSLICKARKKLLKIRAFA